MRLLLFRHAKSSRPSELADHHRPLSKKGRKASKRMGRYMADKALIPDEAIVSTASRTQETWYLARSRMQHKVIARSESRAYDASLKSLLEIVRETSLSVQTLMVVGHNPGLWELSLKLCDGTKSGPHSRLERKMPTASLAIIDFEGENWSTLEVGTGKLRAFATPGFLDS